MQINDAAGVILRMRELFGVKKDAELAVALGTTPQTISSWRSRDTIPYALCVRLSAKKDVFLDWLILGIGPVHRNEVNEQWHPYLANPDKEEVEILALLKKLPDDVKHELLDAAKVKGKVHILEEKMHDMQSQIQAMLQEKQLEQAQSQQQDSEEKPEDDD